MATKTLDRLWALAKKVSKKSGKPARQVFDPIGLILVEPLAEGWYDCTPINASSFAHTGGDGVHYSLLHLNGQLSDNSPVVMTVPMMWDRPNMILGANLHEFLCLGCKVGYFALEQLVYDKANTIRWIEMPETCDEYESPTSDEKHLLQTLTKEFNLEPWEHLEQRLDELQHQFLPSLELQSQ